MEIFSEHLYRWDDVFQATIANDFKAVESLVIQYRVDVNIISQEGLTLLHICAKYGHLETAKGLLSLGASTTIRDRESGWTALHRAVYFRHAKLALLLVQAGAQLDAEWRRFGVSSVEQLRALQQLNRDYDGLTPLDLLSRANLDNPDRENVGITNSLMCFGKADFILGVPLPNSAPNIIRPRRIETLDSCNVVDMVASKFHSLALCTDGRVFSWGHGRSGKLGHGNEDIKMHPCVVEGLLRVVVRAIAASESHSLAVTVEGDLYSWGSDRFGQLGLGTVGGPTDASNRIVTAPRRVDSLRKMAVVTAAAGEAHSLCYTKDGDLYVWGSNQHGQLGLRPNETSCGSNGIASCTTPKRLAFLDKVTGNKPFKKYGLLQIAASYNGSLILCGPKSDSCFQFMDAAISDLCNQVYQWGYGIAAPTRVHFSPKSGGKRSRGPSFSETVSSDNNIEFLKPASVNVSQITAGKHHNAAVCSLGVVYTWGLGSEHLGHGVEYGNTNKHHISLSNPQIVEALLVENGGGKIVSISATLNRTCAVSDVGDLYTWGSTFDKGVLGVGPDGSSCYQPVPERVSGIKQACKVSVGEDHTLVLVAIARPTLPLQGIMAYHASPSVTTTTTTTPKREENDGEEDNEDEQDDLPYFLSAVDIDDAPYTGGGQHRKEKRNRKQESNSKRKTTSIMQPCVSAVPSLLDLCQREVAKSVSVRNAIPTLLFAEMYNVPLLAEYTLKFMEENLDSILVESKSQDINKLVESIEIDSYSPEERSTMAKKLRGTIGDHKENSISNSLSISANNGHVERNRKASQRALDEFQINDETVKTMEEASKMIRSIKKKLSHIDELESKRRQDKDYSLSVEQEEKLSRKKGLYSALAKLEQYQLRYSKRAQPKETIEPVSSHLESDLQSDKDPVVVVKPGKVRNQKATMKPPDFSEWGKMLGSNKEEPSGNTLTPITIPPATMETLGTPTPPPPVTVVLEESSKAAKPWSGWASNSEVRVSTPVLPVQTKQLDTITKSNSVKSLKDILKEEEEDAAKAKYKSTRKFSCGEDGNGSSTTGSGIGSGVVAYKAVPLSTATPSGRTVLSPAVAVTPPSQQPVRAPPSGVVVTPTARRAGVPPKPATDHKDLNGADRKGYDLADFFLPPAASAQRNGSVDTASPMPLASQVGLTPSSKMPPPTPTSGFCWATPLKATDKSGNSSSSSSSIVVTSSGAGKKITPCSFSAIQEEEEMVKRNSNMTHLKGNEMCPWNVERRARAESMEEVIRRQSREKQDQLELEEQMKMFAEMERLEKEQEKEKTAKRRRHKQNKPQHTNTTTATTTTNNNNNNKTNKSSSKS